MTWRAPVVERPDGSLTAPERELLQGYLQFYRSTLLCCCNFINKRMLWCKNCISGTK